MQKIKNFAPILLTFAVTAGVLFHDIQLEKVTSVAFALPAALATYGAAHMVSGSEHTHVERVTFSNQSRVFHSTLPKITPRDNENHYIQPKKTISNSGNTSLWPSV